MKNFLLNAKPNFGETTCVLADEKNNKTHYELRQIKGNGCVFIAKDYATDIEKDHVTFTKLDLKALYCLLKTKE